MCLYFFPDKPSKFKTHSGTLLSKAIDFSKEVYIFLKYGSFLFPKEFIVVWFKPMVKFSNFKKTFSFCSFCCNFFTSSTSSMSKKLIIFNFNFIFYVKY